MDNGIDVPFILCCFEWSCYGLEDLLGAIAAMNDALKNGTTSLIIAAHKGRIEIMREVLKRGADRKAATTSNNFGNPISATSFNVAKRKGHVEVIGRLRS
jgi:ankyrin repeat protein